MELIKLLGVLIVIVGFALKLDSILIIFLALIATGIVGGLGVGGLLETIGTNFVANRSMAIFIMILLVTGTLERNGLREAAANLIRKVKSATAGKLVAVYAECSVWSIQCQLRWSCRIYPSGTASDDRRCDQQ